MILKKRIPWPWVGRTLERVLFLALICVAVDFSWFVTKRAVDEISTNVAEKVLALIRENQKVTKPIGEDHEPDKVAH